MCGCGHRQVEAGGASPWVPGVLLRWEHAVSGVCGQVAFVVVDETGIVEEGGHDALLARGGAYAALHRAQFGHAGRSGTRGQAG